MEAICSSEMSVDLQRITRPYIPEHGTLRNDACEDLKSYKLQIILQSNLTIMNIELPNTDVFANWSLFRD
jgi:hypothetical protein